jgi:hypothetical protein
MLLAGMTRTILGDIVEKIVSSRPNTTVVDRLDGQEDRKLLVERIVDTRANVVVLELDESEVPAVFNDLMDSVGGLVVVGVARDGRQVLVQADNDGMSTIAAVCSALSLRDSDCKEGEVE